jgi:hypothetical protein
VAFSSSRVAAAAIIYERARKDGAGLSMAFS